MPGRVRQMGPPKLMHLAHAATVVQLAQAAPETRRQHRRPSQVASANAREQELAAQAFPMAPTCAHILCCLHSYLSLSLDLSL